jgi:hypothetical protein
MRSNHARTRANVAQLLVGFACFLQYAVSVQALTEAEKEAWYARAHAALLDAAERQEGHHGQARPEQRFLELLASAIASGRAHVADGDGLAPDNAEAWGWRPRLVGTGINVESRLEPMGARVGWLNPPEGLFLDRAAAVRAAGEMDADSGIGVSAETLAKRLHQGGHLASISSEKEGRLTVRRRLEAANRRVLHLRASIEGLSAPRQTGNIGNTGNGEEEPNTNRGTEGHHGVPGLLVSGSGTGNTTGNGEAAFPASVPGAQAPGAAPGTDRPQAVAPTELDPLLRFPALPVFPVCRAEDGDGENGSA